VLTLQAAIVSVVFVSVVFVFRVAVTKCD